MLRLYAIKHKRRLIMKADITSITIEEKSILKFEQFLYERENAEATIQKYKRDLQTFFRFLGGERIVTKAELLEYKAWLIKKYKINSVNSMLASVNQFFEFLDATHLKVKRIRTQKNLFLQEEKELTEVEYVKLIQTAIDEGKKQLSLCIETIGATGIRISELKYFTVETVKKGRIEIFNKGKYRTIFIPGIIRKKLLDYCKTENLKTGAIFITRSGKPKDRSNIWREMKALKARAGIREEKIFPHNLRHFFARKYYDFTKDIAGLADLLGHSNMNVTRIYTSNTGRIYQKQLDELQEKNYYNIISVML